ncbi:MAG: histidinol-phosphate transaminase [Albidovulum sp.]|nr:histidinol-phosphate transaminase [Albidovulum sp.]
MTVHANSSLSGVKPYKQGRSEISGRKRVVKLSSNELPYPPSPAAIQAFRETEQNLNRYPDGSQAALRKAVASIHGVPQRNIFAGNGSDEAIALLIRSVLSAGDSMVTSENSFLMAEIYARSVGARVEKCREFYHRVDVDAILEAASETARIVYICSPNNTSGTYTTDEELRKLDRLLHPETLMIVDAAYAEFADASDYGNGMRLFEPDGRVAVTRTFSKAYGLAAQRIGWALAPDSVVDAVSRVRSPFNTNTAALNAAVAAVQDQDYLKRTVSRIKYTRDYFSSRLRDLELNVIPSQANFVLVSFPHGGNQAVSLDAWLQENGILGRPVEGDANEFRISIGTEDEMELAFEAIREWVGSRNGAGRRNLG